MVRRASGVRNTTGEPTDNPERGTKEQVSVEFYRDELWPFYEVRRVVRKAGGQKRSGTVVDVPKTLYTRWITAMHEFDVAQREMRHYYDQIY